MVRLPCCDKVGVKRGPWTPEEDIMLVSYIQEHGPGNWRAVPNNTGLQRCSKSCRLRWTNYLRPGIKRGSFTDHEEKTIIQLQALLGNKWAAIATYLPERTDNDIKNYWNTHLKKKLKKLQEGHDSHFKYGYSSSQSISRGQWEKRLQTDIKKAKEALNEALSFNDKPNPSLLSELKPNKEHYNSFSSTKLPPSSSSYMSSMDNIANLLKNWEKNSPKLDEETKSESKNNATDASETFESAFGLDSFGSSNSSTSRDLSPEASIFRGESKLEIDANQVPLAAIENWLFDIEDGFEVKEEFANFSFDQNEDLF